MLSALIKREEQEQEEEKRVGSLQLISAIKAKGEVPKSGEKGRLFVKAKIRGRTVKALVDTGASNNFLREDEAKKMGIPYERKQGWLKSVNSEPKATFGVARDVKVCLGDWIGLMDFSVVTMDDHPIILGMEFIDKVKAVPIPFANTMCILEEGNIRVVPLEREARLQENHISAMKLSKGTTGKQPTYLAALKEVTNVPYMEDVPKNVGHILEEFKDAMPPKLPKRLPPKRKVDSKIKSVIHATSPTAVPYHMAPPNFGKLATRKQPMTPYTLASGYKGPTPTTFKFAKGRYEKTDLAKAYLVKAAKKRKKWADTKKMHTGVMRRGRRHIEWGRMSRTTQNYFRRCPELSGTVRNILDHSRTLWNALEHCGII